MKGKTRDAINDVSEKMLPTIIVDILDKRGKLGISLILTSLASVALFNGMAKDLLNEVSPLIEKYATKEKK